MTPEVVVGPGGSVLRLTATEGGGEGDPDDAPDVGGGEPTLLVVVVPGQLPSILLHTEKKTSQRFQVFSSFYFELYSTLLHLPPSDSRCWDRARDCCDFAIGMQSDAQTLQPVEGLGLLECLSLRRSWVPPLPPPQAGVSPPLDPKGGGSKNPCG